MTHITSPPFSGLPVRVLLAAFLLPVLFGPVAAQGGVPPPGTVETRAAVGDARAGLAFRGLALGSQGPTVPRAVAPAGAGVSAGVGQQAGTIAGVVTDDAGSGLPGVTVTLTGPVLRTIFTDAEGGYRFTGLPPGTYEVLADLDAFATEAVGDVEVVPGSDVTVDIVLPLAVSEEVTVRGTPPGRYHVDSTSSATRTDIPFIKLPRAVASVPEQIIIDQAATDVSEVYHNVSGVYQEDGFGGTRDDYNIRGFRRAQSYEDGHRLTFDGRVVMSNVERVEMLKGPASLFGQVRPGGILNVITKRPQPVARRYAQVTLGSYGQRRGMIDLTGPVREGSSTLYRVVSSVENSDSFRDFSQIDRDVFAPQVSFRPGINSSLNLRYEYMRDRRPLDRGNIILNGVPADVPRSRRFGEPWELGDFRRHLFVGDFVHQINDRWSLSTKTFVELGTGDDFQARPLSVTEDGILTRRSDGSRDRNSTTYLLSGILQGNVSTGIVEHNLTLGIDNRDRQSDRRFVRNPAQVELDIFNPVFGLLAPAGDADLLFTHDRDELELGLFVQDHIGFSEHFSLLFGGRLDRFKQANLYTGALANRSNDLPWKTAFNPQVGAVYNPTADLALYTSYAESFTPNTAFDDEGNVFDPREGRQFEVGFKTALNDDRVHTTVAWFDLKETNVLESVNGVLMLVGEQQSRGFEVDISTQPVDGLNLIASYGYLDPEFLTGGRAGNMPRNTANHSGSVYASFERNRFGLSGGAYYRGQRFVGSANMYALDPYAVVNLGAWYYIPWNDRQMKLQLNVKNLTDAIYYHSGGSLRLSPVPWPRQVVTTLGFDW